MPIYEYESREDGTIIELVRPMSEADKPVDDPDGKGRTFVRRLSTFAPKAGGGASTGVSWGGGTGGGCCPCGKNKGSCGAN